MKLKIHEKTIEELKLHKKQNDEQIYISNERTRMSHVNQLDYKLGTTLGASMFPYFIIITTGMFTDMFFLTNFIPKEIIPIILTGSSLSIGSIINYLHHKKYKTTERFLSFTKAKNETEKIEEEVYYKIELEKANNRNKVIEKTIDTIESNQIFLKTISSKYNISEKNEQQTEEETIKILKEINTILKEKYVELDILTTKKVLNENFWRIRSKAQRIMDMSLVSLYGALTSLMFTTFLPFITMDSLFETISTLTRDIYFFTPLIIGSLGTNLYWIKRSKDRKEAFLRLNKTLGKRALFETIKFENNESEQFEKMIEKTINDICVIEVQYIEQKRIIENFEETETTEKTNQKDRTHEEIHHHDIVSPYGFNNIEREVEGLEETNNQELKGLQAEEEPKLHKKTRKPKRK